MPYYLKKDESLVLGTDYTHRANSDLVSISGGVLTVVGNPSAPTQIFVRSYDASGIQVSAIDLEIVPLATNLVNVRGAGGASIQAVQSTTSYYDNLVENITAQGNADGTATVAWQSDRATAYTYTIEICAVATDAIVAQLDVLRDGTTHSQVISLDGVASGSYYARVKTPNNATFTRAVLPFTFASPATPAGFGMSGWGTTGWGS